MLTHLRLQTEDGTERSGTDVSLEQIQELSNQGLSPTWYVEEEWAAKRYGPKDEVHQQPPQPEAGTAKPENVWPGASGAGQDVLVRSLETQIQDLQQDKERLYAELAIKNEQIREANERTRESNVLMKELQTLLGNVQQHALMPLPTGGDIHRSGWKDGIVVGDKPSEDRESTTSSQRKRPSKSRQTKSKTSPSKLTPKTPQPAKPKWNEFPTFKRLLSRSDNS
ncbi:MAG: hypothetical protein R3B91_16130 [Planctomycetaceae bacterium]